MEPFTAMQQYRFHLLARDPSGRFLYQPSYPARERTLRDSKLAGETGYTCQGLSVYFGGTVKHKGRIEGEEPKAFIVILADKEKSDEKYVGMDTGIAAEAIVLTALEAGIGSCMVANKVPNIRASMCYNHATALNSREHNNANVLTLGAGMIDTALARQIIMTWLNTKFGGGRHARRVDKIMMIERR